MVKAPDDPVVQAIFHITFWVLIGITFAGLVARIYVRVYLRGSIFRARSWQLSDILVALSWLGFFECGVVQIYIYTNFNSELTEERWILKAKLGIVYNTTFWLWIFTIKLAMLCFFDELIPKQQMPRSWHAIRIIAIMVAIGGISSFIYSFLWCLPFERQWAMGPSFCWNDADARIPQRLYRQVWHCLTDLAILAIPIPLIPHLAKIGKRQRVGAVVMLFLGVVCTVSAIIYTVLETKVDFGWTDRSALTYMEYGPIVELAAAIFIQCVPSMKYLISGQSKKSGSNISEITGGFGSGGSRMQNPKGMKGYQADEEQIHVLEDLEPASRSLTPEDGVTIPPNAQMSDAGLMGVNVGTWRQISDSAIVGHDTSDPRSGWI